MATGLMSLYHRKRLTPFMGSAALQQRDVTLGCIRRAVCAKNNNGGEKGVFFFFPFNSEKEGEEEEERDKQGVREARRGCL